MNADGGSDHGEPAECLDVAEQEVQSAAVCARATKPQLSKRAILSTARVIADELGLRSVTLRRIAAELGTGQASLYRHISDRRELLVLLVDEIAREFPIGDQCLAPRQRLLEQWMNLYQLLSRHRWAAQVIVEGDLSSQHAAPFARRQLTDLRTAGLGPQQAALTYRSLFNLLLGFLLNEHPTGHGATEMFEVGDHMGEFRWAMERLLIDLPVESVEAAAAS